MRIVACLNGDRRPGAHPGLPASPAQIAADARAAVDAGADTVHIHPRDGRSEQSLAPQALTSVLDGLRGAIPDTPVGVTTALSAEPDPWRRFDLVGRWGALPDWVTVSLEEPGSVEVVRLLNDRRVEVAAVVPSVSAARIMLACELEFARVVIAPPDAEAAEARATVRGIEAVLDRGGSAVPRSLRGKDATAWPLLDDAAAAGYGVWIGLADVLTGPGGQDVHDNAELVSLVARRRADAGV